MNQVTSLGGTAVLFTVFCKSAASSCNEARRRRRRRRRRRSETGIEAHFRIGQTVVQQLPCQSLTSLRPKILFPIHLHW